MENAVGDKRYSFEVEQLLAENILIAAQAVAGKRQIASDAIFIFDS